MNTFAPVAVNDAFRMHVAMRGHDEIIGITSGSGVIFGSVGRGSCSYKSSKIGLNMAFRALSADLLGDDIIISVIAPDAVNTDMRREAVGAEIAAHDLPIGAMIKTIDASSLSHSWRVLNDDGRILPW